MHDASVCDVKSHRLALRRGGRLLGQLLGPKGLCCRTHCERAISSRSVSRRSTCHTCERQEGSHHGSLQRDTKQHGRLYDAKVWLPQQPLYWLVVLALIGTSMEYWYVTVPVLVALGVGLIVYTGHNKSKGHVRDLAKQVRSRAVRERKETS